MSGVPDYPLGETLDFKFTTRAFATGVPTVLAGAPVIEVYEDNSVTQITTGETLTVDFDSVVGLNNLRIVATGANGYESGKSYAAIISTGTVGGVSVVGEVVAQFSIERSPALRPTTAGRTLDVTATGEAGIDLDNTVGTIAAAQIATDAITSAKIAADAVAKIIGAVTGTADAGSTSTTIVDAERTEAATDFWQHSIVVMTSGANAGQLRRITAFNSTTDTITVAPAFKSAVGTGNTYTILSTAIADGLRPTTEGQETVDTTAAGTVGLDWGNIENPTSSNPNTNVQSMNAGSIASGVIASGELTNIENEIWDALKSAHTVANSFGDFLDIEVSSRNSTTPPTSAAIADAVLDEDMTGHQTTGTLGQAIGDPVANTKTLYAALITDAAGASVTADVATVDTVVDGIQADLDNATDGLGAIKSDTAAILVDTDVTIPGTITTLQSDTDNIQTRLPTLLVGGKMDSNIGAISSSTAAADQMELNVEATLNGTASGTPTTTTMVSDIGVTVDDQFNGRIIIFQSDTTTAALRNQATDITACTASTNTLTFTALTTAAVSGDTFVIV